MSSGDDELMEELRRVLGMADPAPDSITEFARAALGWRTIDADLAELLSDSALDLPPALTRSAGSARRLTFQADQRSIDVEVRESGSGRLLIGQLAPPAVAMVEIELESGEIAATAAADALGRFRLELPAAGRIRLRVRIADSPGAPIQSSWIVV